MPRTISEKQKKAMAAGREKRAAERRAGAADRVAAYRAWCVRDAEITMERNAGNMIPREPMPAVSDYDFKISNGEEPLND